MLSEFILFGKHFFKMHRRWLFIFVRDEAILLGIGLIGLFLIRRPLLVELTNLNLIWLFIIPPCLAQIKLAIHLGITFSLKSPEAWEMRLPFAEGRACLWSYFLISLNAVLFIVPFFPIWTLFYEMTGYPIAFVLVLIPCLAFQASRSPRTPIAGITASIVAFLVFSLASAIPLILAPINQTSNFYQVEFFRINPAMDMNIVFIGVSLIVALMIDRDRKKLFGPLLAIGLAFCGFIGFETFRGIQFQDSTYFRKVDEITKISSAQFQQCKSFGESFYQSPIFDAQKANNRELPSKEDLLADQYFNTKSQLIQALEAIKAYPGWPYSRTEMIKLWEELPSQPAPYEMLGEFLKITSCADIELANYLLRMIPGISRIADLKGSERQKLLGETWKVTSQITGHAVTLMQARISMDLLRKFVDYHLVEGIPSESLSALASRLEEMRKKAQDKKISFSHLRVPTNQRMKVDIQNFFVHEIEATASVVDQLIDLVKSAKLESLH